MKILVACEYSGVVRDAFIARGHDAISCDLLPTESPGPHIQGDVLEHIGGGYDMMLAFMPCTYLCSSGIHWNSRTPGRAQKTAEAAEFFLKLANAPIKKISLENPIGVMSTLFRKPDQIIQPYNFGHDASKQTCLWLKGLPLLQPTKFIEPRYACKSCGTIFEYKYGKYGCCLERPARPIWGNQTPSGQNKLGPSENRWKERSKTYEGIASAMAEQWG